MTIENDYPADAECAEPECHNPPTAERPTESADIAELVCDDHTEAPS